MLDLTFGEQVKIILSRKGMTIKELAETIEERTGKKMSRQNLMQRPRPVRRKKREKQNSFMLQWNRSRQR